MSTRSHQEVPWHLTHLVGVLEDEVFALRLFQTGVDDGMQDAPGIGHVQHHLISKLSGFDLLHTQNLVCLWVTRMLARDIPKEDRW